MEPLRRNDVAGPRRQDFIDSVTALILIPIQSTRRRAEAFAVAKIDGPSRFYGSSGSSCGGGQKLGISLSLMEMDSIC